MLRFHHTLPVLAALVFSLPGPVRAQEDFAGVEEIVVTAERREQTVQDLAQAITALTADDLDRTNVEDIHGLQYQVPSLHVTGGLPRPTIRGIGQDVVGPATDPGFILHINGTYVTQLATALLGFHDMERVEVLPGPTGIDYGRATTGGSMNFIWKKANPNEAEFSGDAQLASYDAFRIRSVLNVPLKEGVWASRWSGAYVFAPRPYELSDGSPDGLNQELASNSLGAGGTLRHSLRWTPNEDFSADFIVQWSRDGTPGGKARILDQYPAYTYGVDANGDECRWSDAATCSTMGQNPLFGGPPDYTDATPNPADPHKISANRATQQHVETFWAQVILEWNLGDEYTLRSISNYQHFDYFVDQDWDGSNVEAERLQLDNRENGWAQEVTLASNYDGPFNFVVGVNGQINEARTLLPIWDYQASRGAEKIVIYDAFDSVGGGPNTYQQPLLDPIPTDALTLDYLGLTLAEAEATNVAITAGNAGIAGLNQLRAALPLPSVAQICGDSGTEACRFNHLPSDRPIFDLDTDTETMLFGAFGRFDYAITDTISATVGVRFSYTQRDWTDRSRFDVFIESGDVDILDALTVDGIEEAEDIERSQIAFWTGVGPGSNGVNRGDISAASCEQYPYGGFAAFIPDATARGLGCPTALRLTSLQLQKSWNSTDGLLRLEWRPTDESLLYGYVATGERHGGFNFFEAAPFDSEEIIAYEIGAKTEWLDNTLVVNGAVFLYDYGNKFVSVALAGGGSATTENIGDARVTGAEIRIQYEPSAAFRADLTVGYLDTEILDSYTSEDLAAQPGFGGFCPESVGTIRTHAIYATPVEGGAPGLQHGLGSCGRTLVADLQGNPLPRAPEWTVAFGVEYAIELASGATLTPRVDFSWRDRVNLWQYNNPNEWQESYTNTNLRLRYTPASETWYAEAFVENAEDEDAVRTNPEARISHPQYWLAEPRLYGVRVGWSFAELPW